MIRSIENNLFKFEEIKNEDNAVTYYTHVSPDGIEVTDRINGISILLRPKTDPKKVTIKALIDAVTSALKQHIVSPNKFNTILYGFVHHFSRLFRDDRLASN